MKEKLLKLLKKHKISRNSYYTESPYDKLPLNPVSSAETRLIENWSGRVAKGWYGISIGQPTPESFFKLLDDFLRLVEKYNSDFEILQIKLKMGSIRIYLDKINSETQSMIDLLENEMFDQHLIY